MKNSLLFDFTVDKAAKTVFVNREFAANLALVWDAFTKPEILDQWWGPVPWVSKTKFMDFKVGGRRLYAMISPEGEARWSLQEFTSIHPKINFKSINSFTDKDGNIHAEWPSSEWELNFSEQTGPDGNRVTKVSISIKHKTLETLEKYIEMGFKQGFTMCLQQLDGLLLTSKG